MATARPLALLLAITIACLGPPGGRRFSAVALPETEARPSAQATGARGLTTQPHALGTILSEHFDVVFRIGECDLGNRTAQGTPLQLEAPSAWHSSYHHRGEGVPLCLWRYHPTSSYGDDEGGRLRELLAAILPERHPKVTDAGEHKGNVHTGAEWVQLLELSHGAQHGAEQQGHLGAASGQSRRLQQQPQQEQNSASASASGGAGSGGSVHLSPMELSPFNTMRVREALAYRAHLTALRLCANLPDDGNGGAPGSRRRTCAVVTDEVSWVAAGDCGALECALRRPGASSASTMAASLAARGADTTAPSPRFFVLPWGYNRGAGSCRTAAHGLYDSTDSWLDSFQAGLSAMRAASDGSARGAHRSSRLALQDPDWDVLALPSACAGWEIGGNGAATAFRSPPDSARWIAGCVLGFTSDAAATISSLASAAAANSSTSAAMLPCVNAPFYAKMGLLARQGVLRMHVAAPDTEVAAALPACPVAGASTDRAALAAAECGSLQRSPRRRFLLYTNAGSQSIWRMWAGPERKYDLLVAYYGPERNLTRIADPIAPDYLYRSHGSKHQNLHRLHVLYPGLLGSYDVVAAWDDDLVASTQEVNAMFERFAGLSGPPGDPAGIWLGQPSLRNGSKVDHALLANQPALALSYTSFVENNACVFRSDKLVELLDSTRYTGELMGWGVDYAYMWALGWEQQDKFVVLHDCQVTNPRTETKEGGREILRLASQEARIAQWKAYAARFKINARGTVAYKCVPAVPDLPASSYPWYCPERRGLL